jgi:hypothetical protein
LCKLLEKLKVTIANAIAQDGLMCAQLFLGMKSVFTSIHGEKKSLISHVFFLNALKSFGAMKGLFAKIAKSESQRLLLSIKLEIGDKNTISKIQGIKFMTNMTMNCAGAPPDTGLLCIYCVQS